MIMVDVKKRIKADEILKHPWMVRNCLASEVQHQAADQFLCENVIESLKKFRAKSLLKRELISIMVRQLDYSQVKDLRAVFEQFDKNSDGIISHQELKEAFFSIKQKIGTRGKLVQEITRIMGEIDHNNNQEINYTEFLTAAIDIKKLLTP